MIDRLVGSYASHKFNERDDSYQPSMAIASSKLMHEDGKYLTVLFSPWHGGDRAYDVLANRLAKRESAVLRYKAHHQVLEPNVSRVVDSFEHIQSTAADDVTRLVEKHGYDHVDLVAASLGNVSLGMVAKALPDFASATMVVPGSNLARGLWQSRRAQAMRQELEEQGVDEATLDNEWSILAPKSAASSLAGKDVRVIMSTTDAVIPPDFQQEMVDIVSKVADHLDVRTTRLGHMASVASFCLAGALE
jgi:pimeloyl-ACP methyl ester carboxylesterase